MEVEVCVEREREKKREKRRRSRSKNLSKRESKIKQKSTKNRPRRDRKSTKKSIKNWSKINLGGVPGGLWRHLAANTEKCGWQPVFWDPLGAILAASWAVLAASWGRLGGLGGLLGPSWARLGGRNRTPSRPNIDPKIDQNFDAFGDRLFGGFWWILLPKMEPRCLQKPPGNRCQSRKAIFSKNLVFPKEKQ